MLAKKLRKKKYVYVRWYVNKVTFHLLIYFFSHVPVCILFCNFFYRRQKNIKGASSVSQIVDGVFTTLVE